MSDNTVTESAEISLCTEIMESEDHTAYPGFCYDPEKRRYFRLPPSHFSQLPFYDGIPTNVTPLLSSLKPHTPLHTPSLYQVLQTRQRIFDQDDFIRSLYRSLPASLCKSIKAEPPCANFKKGAFDCKEIMVDQTGKIMVLKCITANDNCYIAVCDILDGTMSSSLYSSIICKEFTDVLLEQDGSGGQVLLKLSCDAKSAQLQHFSIKKDEQSSLSLRINNASRIDLNGSPSVIKINSCVYWRDKYLYGLGFSNGSVKLYLENCGRISSPICNSHVKSPVFSLGFAKKSELLFSGHQNGVINAWDFRGKPQMYWTANELKEGRVSSSVIAIHCLRDANYLISSAFNSKLSLWDVRMYKKVVQYNGHINNYKHCNSLVDNTETFLASVGSDSCVRFWTVGDGQLTRSIQPEEYGYVSDCGSPIPAICYSETFGGTLNGKPTVGIFDNCSQPSNISLYSL